jgi:hypothetical protein
VYIIVKEIKDINKEIYIMKISKEDRKILTELVDIYFMYNPQNNKGMAFKIKTWDIISAYYLVHKKTYEEIKLCIESKPMCTIPIWDHFNNYFTIKNKPIESNSYKKTVSDSINVDDWL